MLVNKILSNLKPPVKYSPSQWANNFRYLSSATSALPGKYSTDRFQYLVDIYDALLNPKVEEIVVIKSSQVGLSEMLITLVGYYIDIDPRPILYVMPTTKMAEQLVKERFNFLFLETPRIKNKIDMSHTSGNTILNKTFAGGTLTLAGSNSPVSLSSRPISLLFLDEIDRFPRNVSKEGDPITLAKKRTTSFSNKKIISISTPTIAGLSRIEELYNNSNQQKFYVPCHICNHSQVLVFDNIKYQDDDPKTSRYVCTNCHKEWNDLERWENIKKGFWKSDKPDIEKIYGYHLNELLSPFSTIEKIVDDYLKAKRGDATNLTAFYNTSLGLPYSEDLELSSEKELYDRREDFSIDKIPNDVYYLTLAVDTQDRRLEQLIVGWGKDQRMYVLDHKVIQGSPDDSETWEPVENSINKTYVTQDKRQLNISVSCIDSGGHYNRQVIEFCTRMRKTYSKTVHAIKGSQFTDSPIWPRKSSVSKHNNQQFYIVGVSNAKQTIFDRLKIATAGPRYIRFSNTLDHEFFNQLISEKPEYVKNKNGKLTKIWKQLRANEAFDLMNYNLISLYSNINKYENCFNVIQQPTFTVGKSNYLEQYN